jgi:hypothetical protein
LNAGAVQHGIRQKRDDGGIAKTLAAFIRRADESSGTASKDKKKEDVHGSIT